MKTNEVFQSLVNYGAEAPFWALVKQATGYFEGESSTINKLVTHILLTATTRTLRMEYLAGLDGFISTPHQAWCYDFVSEWIVGENRQDLVEILRNVEEELILRKRFKQVPLDDLVGTEVFPCVNECILTQIMTEISNHIINVDMIINTVEKRRTLAWYDDVECYYEGILQVAKMQAFFLEHSAGFHTVEARNIWKEYTEDYYRMDTYYRHYHLAFGKSLTVGNDHLDDLFKQVTDKVEGLYTHWFLGELGNNWSDACADELAQYGRILLVPQQVDFYNQKVKNEDNRVFVIISDLEDFIDSPYSDDPDSIIGTEEASDKTEEKPQTEGAENTETNGKAITLYSHMNGTAVKLEDVEDEVFSQKILGEGAAVEPSEGKLYAPCDGKIDSVFDTKHAVNMVSDDGVEILLHIGIDTVKLGGQYFEAHVSDGQEVKKGDLLISFDMDKIKAAGYKVTTPLIIGNTDDYASVEPVAQNSVSAGDMILKIK